jgi:hypothetical protein
MLRRVLFAVSLTAALVGLSTSPALACGEGLATAWLQPTTVQKGNSFLVTGIEVPENWLVIFHFLNSANGNWKHYTMQQDANSNCVANQEFIDTSDFKKGNWFVNATEYNAHGFFQGVFVSSNQLRVVDRTSPAPPLSAYPCGQTAHAWFGPSVVNRNSNMFVAAVALPNRYVDFYFVSQSGGGILPGGLARLPIRIGPAHSNCVADDLEFRAGSKLGPGNYEVYAGFFDEYGRYHYDFLGPLTVT